ncbi:MAG: hypothetical protein J6Y44_02765 [Clostridia bacterium]|nr:hypothetical protein [Clostridia bacterium]
MLKIIGAYLAAILITLAAYCEQNVLFNEKDGDVEYYLQSAGSDCRIATPKEVFGDIKAFFSIKGVCIKGVDGEFVDGFLKRFNAEFVLSESVESADSKYYYSDKIWGYKLVNGKKVNIHVVKNGSGFSIASPIVFGAY